MISVGAKLSLGIVSLIAMATLSLGITLAESSRENLVESKRAAAIAFADLFVASIAPSVDFRDEESLQRHVGHFRSRPDAVSLVVWASDQDAPVVQSFSDSSASPPPRPATTVASVQVIADRVVVTRPIEGPVAALGTAQLAFSLAAEDRAYRSSRRRIFVGVLALGTALAGVILTMLRVLITSPLRELTRAAERLRAGHRATVRVRANDEVGAMASAFNAMAATIADREQKVAAAYRELEEVSLTDPLTGLRNRRFFAETVRQETARSLRRHSEAPGPVRRNRDIVVLSVDLDLFKRINDTLGHSAGDDVLRETGRRLLRTMRESDYVLRWGGEEFLIVARDTERGDAPVIAARVLQAVGGVPYRLGDGTTTRVTCSVGWAPFPWASQRGSDADLERMMVVADRAMYHAKRTGRNRATGVETIPGRDCDLRKLADEPLESLDGNLVSLVVTAGPE